MGNDKVKELELDLEEAWQCFCSACDEAEAAYWRSRWQEIATELALAEG